MEEPHVDLLHGLILLLQKSNQNQLDAPLYLQIVANARKRAQDAEQEPPPAPAVPVLQAMQQEVLAIQKYREEQHRWRQAAALQKLLADEERYRGQMVNQRAVAIHSLLSQRTIEKNAMALRRQRHHNMLECEFLEAVAMMQHDDLSALPMKVAGGIPVVRRRQLHQGLQEQHGADMLRYHCALDAAQLAAQTAFGFHVINENRLASLDQEVTQEETQLAKDDSYQSAQEAAYEQAMAHHHQMEVDLNHCQATLAHLQQTLCMRQAHIEETDANYAVRKAAWDENEAQRMEREEARAKAISMHQRIRASPHPRSPKGPRSPAMTTEELHQHIAYLSTWRLAGKKVTAKNKQWQPQLDDSSSAASIVLRNLYMQ